MGNWSSGVASDSWGSGIGVCNSGGSCVGGSIRQTSVVVSQVGVSQIVVSQVGVSQRVVETIVIQMGDNTGLGEGHGSEGRENKLKQKTMLL
jgi:hypothetical protein